MNVDVFRIIADIKSTAERIRPLKKALRRTWEEPMGDVQVALVRLKRRATELCILRAHLRGRIHVHKRPPSCYCGKVWDPERHASRVAERVALAYALEDEEQSVARESA